MTSRSWEKKWVTWKKCHIYPVLIAPLASLPQKTTIPHLLRRQCESCISHNITSNFNKFNYSFCFLTFQRPELVLKFTPHSYLTWTWCLISHVQHQWHQALLYTPFLLPSSSPSPPQLPPFLPILHFSIPSSSPLLPGAFHEGCVNMRKSIPSPRQLSRGRSETCGVGMVWGWRCVLVYGREKGMCCSINTSPLMFSARFCVCKGLLRLHSAWLTGSEMGLSGKLSACVSCMCVNVVMWVLYTPISHNIKSSWWFKCSGGQRSAWELWLVCGDVAPYTATTTLKPAGACIVVAEESFSTNCDTNENLIT